MTQEFVVCVVGLTNTTKEIYGTRPGVGKSCLCFRFAYPSHDVYVDSHPSIVALHEFESPVINCSHFLYWGSPLKTYPVKGGELSVRYHLLEHSVIYQDITSKPFNLVTRPDTVECYIKRIIGPIESSGKHSYYSRDDITESNRYTKLQYPRGLSKLLRGFLVVFDVSVSGKELETQCKRVEPILEYLYKHKRKFVIVVTKRDNFQVPALDRAYEMRKKFRTHLVETSAKENLNVEEAFRILAQRVLMRSAQGLSDTVLHYDRAAQLSIIQRGSAKRSLVTYLTKKVSDCDERLSSIQASEEFKECVQWVGTFESGQIFALHVLKLYNRKVDTYAGTHENPEIRLEFLEDFVDQRTDLSAYKKDLKE